MFKKIFLALTLTINSLSVLNAQSVGGSASGSTSFCDSINSGFISLSGYAGDVLYWQSSKDKGLSWTNITNPTSTQSYHNLVKTTSFRAVVKNGSFVPDTSSIATVSVRVAGVAGVLLGGGSFCASSGNESIQLTEITGVVLYWQSSVDNQISWNKIPINSATLSCNNLTQNISYRAIVQTLSVCPNDTSSVASFTIHPKTIAGTILKSDSLCYGASGDTLHLNGNVGTVIDWFSSNDNGSNWKSLGLHDTRLTFTTVTQTTWYKSTVRSGVCPIETTVPAIIAVYNKNPANAGEDVTITQFDKITLYGSGNGSPDWSPVLGLTEPHSFNPIVSPFNTTTYRLTLTDAHACVTTDSIKVNVIIPVPTAITPNGDGVNDFFVVDKIETYQQSSLLIFNRWGSIVYKKNPYNNEWNGKSMNGYNLPDDMYYYVLDFGNGEKPVTNYLLLKR